jgi:2-methylisocitrate lyase-like PEP mutase family enzyme
VSVERGRRLRDLHDGPPILMLPNAWDVVSARLFERLGFPAVATTSAAVAWALGYPDGEKIPGEEMLAWVERIARAVDVPLSADLERGYGDPAATAQAAFAAGAVGLNLEDGLEPTDVHVARIQAVREAVPEIVINARTDVFLGGSGDFEEAVERLNAYLGAGADCAFAIGVTDGEVIDRLVRAVRGRLSVMAAAGSPPVRELERLGVARVSVGPGIGRAAYTAAERAARELLERGTYGFVDDAVPSSELNAILASGENG